MAKGKPRSASLSRSDQLAFDFGITTSNSRSPQIGSSGAVVYSPSASTSADAVQPFEVVAVANPIDRLETASLRQGLPTTNPDSVTSSSGVTSPSARTATEVLAPSDRTEGQSEREFFARMSEKAERYEDRMSRLLGVFFVLVLTTVFTKAGVPVLRSVQKKFDIAQIDATLICGVLGASAIIFFLMACYCALRVKQFTPHQGAFFPAYTWAGRAAQYMFNGGVALLLFILVLEVVLTFWDIVYTVVYLVEHILYKLDGWDPLPTPKKL